MVVIIIKLARVFFKAAWIFPAITANDDILVFLNKIPYQPTRVTRMLVTNPPNIETTPHYLISRESVSANYELARPGL